MKVYKRKFEEGDIPKLLEVGKTYKLNDGGKLKITNIKIAELHIRPKTIIDYEWVTPEGQKGSDRGSLEAVLKNYFGIS